MRILLWVSIWMRRFVLYTLILLVVLSGPVIYTEYTCNSAPGAPPSAEDAARIRGYAGIPPYVISATNADYARTIAKGDPHEFGYLTAIGRYWGAVCLTTSQSAALGGLPGDTKQALYAQGVGHTATLLFKGAYEETLGRIATMVRGPERAPLDDLAAQQAAEFAQARPGPMGGWNFNAAARDTIDVSNATPRDIERMIALNIEYRVRGLATHLVSAGHLPDNNALLVVVDGVETDALRRFEGIVVTGRETGGTGIGISRDRASIEVLMQIGRQGGKVTRIPGHQTVFLALRVPDTTDQGAVLALPDVDGGTRQIVEVPAAGLAARLLAFADASIVVERILGS